MKNLAILGALLFGVYYIDKKRTKPDGTVPPDFLIDNSGTVYVRPRNTTPPEIILNETTLQPSQTQQIPKNIYSALQ